MESGKARSGFIRIEQAGEQSKHLGVLAGEALPVGVEEQAASCVPVTGENQCK